MGRRKRRTKRRHQQESQTANEGVRTRQPEAADTSPAAMDCSPPRSAPSQSRFLLVLAICTTLVWFAGLTGLAILTANPVTLNVRQIVEARYVVSAVLSTHRNGAVDVTKEWKRGAQLRSVQIENLNDTRFDPGVTYLVPLSPFGDGRYQVTPTPPPDGRPLVYPATAETVERLERIIAECTQRAAVYGGSIPKEGE